MTQQQPPYGQPPQQGYGPPPQGYAAPPQPPQAKWYHGVFFIVVSMIFCFPVGLVLLWTSPRASLGARIGGTVAWGFLMLIGAVSNRGDHTSATTSNPGSSSFSAPLAPAAAPAAATPAAANAQLVDIKVLLSEYKDNEVRGDSEFKGKVIRVTGKVDSVKKGLMDGMYVEVGTGKMFEIPQVQCELNDSNAQKAARLSKGQAVTVTGTVGGLMMNVRLEDCDIVP